MAADKVNASQAIGSPCIRNCCLNDQDVCLGCFRTIEEICAWSAMDSASRQQVLNTAKERRKHAGNK
ncbi:MAG: DUF1289 domain-containing protein [Pseudomonadales bacterium]|nr:DUF1289 domain-containing protein [Pseudomonadales bacterium]